VASKAQKCREGEIVT